MAMTRAKLLIAAAALPLASCTVMRVRGESEPARLESSGLVKGHVALGMRDESRLVQASLFDGPSPGGIVELGLWKLFRVEVGLAGVAVGIGPLDTALGVGFYDPEVPEMESEGVEAVPVTEPAEPTEPVERGEDDDAAPRPVETVPSAPARRPLPPQTDAALAEYQVAVGDQRFREGRYDDAVEAYLRAIVSAPDDATTHLVLADALFASGDYHYAAFTIQKALRLDPALVHAGTDKRAFYPDRESFETQLQALRAYLAEHPYDAAAHFVLGYNLLFSGRPAEARAAFETVTSIDPGHAGAKAFAAR